MSRLTASRAPPAPSALTLLYDGLRFLAPGLVWGWLYAPRSFPAALAGHTTAQLVFQPLAGVLLGH